MRNQVYSFLRARVPLHACEIPYPMDGTGYAMQCSRVCPPS